MTEHIAPLSRDIGQYLKLAGLNITIQTLDMYTETYNRRLLSPFHGLQQVICVAGGIAESMNGWDWKLYYDNPAWYPGGQAGKQFISDSGGAEELSQLVKTTAGKQSTATWIK
jgi:hypothetical protein